MQEEWKFIPHFLMGIEIGSTPNLSIGFNQKTHLRTLLEQKKVFILGDGAKKFQRINPKINAQFSRSS